MSREHYKTDAYFKEYIKEEQGRIGKFFAVLQTLEETDISRRKQCSQYITAFEKNVITAMYSSGASKDELKGEFYKYLYVLKMNEISSYAEMVDLLSMAVIFDVEYGDLKGILEGKVFDDPLVLALKRYLKHGRLRLPDGRLMFEKEYGAFWDFLADDKAQEKDFLAYMKEQWYPSCKEMAWYDSHYSDQNIYAGYWCWLAAAVLKIKNKIPAVSEADYVPIELIR